MLARARGKESKRVCVTVEKEVSLASRDCKQCGWSVSDHVTRCNEPLVNEEQGADGGKKKKKIDTAIMYGAYHYYKYSDHVKKLVILYIYGSDALSNFENSSPGLKM